MYEIFVVPGRGKCIPEVPPEFIPDHIEISADDTGIKLHLHSCRFGGWFMSVDVSPDLLEAAISQWKKWKAKKQCDTTAIEG